MSAAKRTTWHVRTTVPVTTPQGFPYRAFMTERVRKPRRGIDRGLYLVSTPDRVSRTAVVKGLAQGPHLVYALDGVTLATVIARFWPTKRAMPAAITHLDAVGDFTQAVKFACEHARMIAERAPTPPVEESTHD